MSYIYLASPYSHPDPFVREQRYLAAMQCVSKMLKQGQWVYSPIVHCHELAKVTDLSKETSFWRPYNFAMLRHAAALHVLLLPGWNASLGVTEECEEAERLNLPIHYEAGEPDA